MLVDLRREGEEEEAPGMLARRESLDKGSVAAGRKWRKTTKQASRDSAGC